jgi:hypothetical protein
MSGRQCAKYGVFGNYKQTETQPTLSARSYSYRSASIGSRFAAFHAG